MDNTNYTTNHRKGQHLTSEERHIIEVRYNKDRCSIYKIAKELNRPFNTIKNEINRGTVCLYDGKVKRYHADQGYTIYKKHRKSSCRRYKILEVAPFIRYVINHFKDDFWSLDACAQRAIIDGTFDRSQTVCTKTLYRYVDLNLLSLKNIDLPEKLKRNKKKRRVQANRKNLGKSIDERPQTVDSREEFGHWEIDSVLGKKNDAEPSILALTERKYRYSIWFKVLDHSAKSVQEAISNLIDTCSEHYTDIFKTITADNGSEFADLSEYEKKGIGIYFTHPYTSCEKGTVERHNRILRKFIPKGKSIDDFTADDIMIFAEFANGLPRKVLGYHTPEELFNAEIDKIYTA